MKMTLLGPILPRVKNGPFLVQNSCDTSVGGDTNVMGCGAKLEIPLFFFDFFLFMEVYHFRHILKKTQKTQLVHAKQQRNANQSDSSSSADSAFGVGTTAVELM